MEGLEYGPAHLQVSGVESELPNSSRLIQEEFLHFVESQNPAAPSWQIPIYSNEAFQLLGIAFENITGETLSDAFNSGIADPLGLKRSFWHAPINDSNAMVANPPGAQRFDEDLGGFTP